MPEDDALHRIPFHSVRRYSVDLDNSNMDPIIKPVYEVMLDFAEKAIINNTGISFDF